MAQKWIINNNNLVLGDVEYHKDLADNHSTTRGGGHWMVLPDKNTLLLFGLSGDFGIAQMEDIISAITNHEVPFYSYGGIEIKLEKNFTLAHSEELFRQKAMYNYKIIKK